MKLSNKNATASKKTVQDVITQQSPILFCQNTRVWVSIYSKDFVKCGSNGWCLDLMWMLTVAGLTIQWNWRLMFMSCTTLHFFRGCLSDSFQTCHRPVTNNHALPMVNTDILTTLTSCYQTHSILLPFFLKCIVTSRHLTAWSATTMVILVTQLALSSTRVLRIASEERKKIFGLKICSGWFDNTRALLLNLFHLI